MQVGDAVALAFDGLTDLVGDFGSGMRSSRMAPVSRNSPTDQLAITSAPIRPASGSIQSQPNVRASTSPTITRTETAASAITWMTAARMLLSR